MSGTTHEPCRGRWQCSRCEHSPAFSGRLVEDLVRTERRGEIVAPLNAAPLVAARRVPPFAGFMARWIWIAVCLAALMVTPRGAQTIAQEPEPLARPTAATRFIVMDVFVNTGAEPLAAYQIEVASTNAAPVKIVGIEGGEPAAFRPPPYYDSAAMQRERVVLGAFSILAADQLPRGSVRVASVHCQVTGDATPEFAGKVVAAASNDGRPLMVRVELKERKLP